MVSFLRWILNLDKVQLPIFFFVLWSWFLWLKNFFPPLSHEDSLLCLLEAVGFSLCFDQYTHITLIFVCGMKLGIEFLFFSMWISSLLSHLCVCWNISGSIFGDSHILLIFLFLLTPVLHCFYYFTSENRYCKASSFVDLFQDHFGSSSLFVFVYTF